MGLLDRLDHRVLGPKGQPPARRRMQAGHWFGIAVTLVVVVAAFVASGSNNPAIWPLAGMALGSLLFGGRAAGSERPLKPGGSNTTTEAQQPHDSGDEDIHNLASSIVDAERGRD